METIVTVLFLLAGIIPIVVFYRAYDEPIVEYPPASLIWAGWFLGLATMRLFALVLKLFGW